MTEPWKFGELPLPQSMELASAVRDLMSAALGLEGTVTELDPLIGNIVSVTGQLVAAGPADLRPRVGPASESARVYLDHSRDIGQFNPVFPHYQLECDETRATGSVRFPLIYEGPPGIVHGGVLALFFDCVVQQHNCDVGLTGKTVSLEIAFKKPTPLETDLKVQVDRSVDGRRIRSEAILLGDDQALCTAQIVTVASERNNLPPVGARRATMPRVET